MADKIFTHGPDNVDTLITTTHENRRGEIHDAIFKDLVLLNWLNQKAKVNVRGGRTIVTHLMTGKNNTVTAYSGFDLIPTTPQQGFTTSQAQWKQYGDSIVVSGREARVQNAGSSQVFDVVRTKLNQADRSIKDDVNRDLFNTSQNSKEIRGLPTLIDATSTIQDINSTSNAFWQADVNTGGSFAEQGLSDFRTLYNDLSKITPSNPVDLILTTSDVHESYEGTQQPQARHTSMDSANGSFNNLMFRTAPVVFDNEANSGVAYFLNSEALELVIDSATDFIVTPFEPATIKGQDAKVALELVALELVTPNRRMLGKVTSITE